MRFAREDISNVITSTCTRHPIDMYMAGLWCTLYPFGLFQAHRMARCRRACDSLYERTCAHWTQWHVLLITLIVIVPKHRAQAVTTAKRQQRNGKCHFIVCWRLCEPIHGGDGQKIDLRQYVLYVFVHEYMPTTVNIPYAIAVRMRCAGDEFMVNIRFYFSFSTRFSALGSRIHNGRRYARTLTSGNLLLQHIGTADCCC